MPKIKTLTKKLFNTVQEKVHDVEEAVEHALAPAWQLDDQGSIIELVDSLIKHAQELRASDIHIDPQNDSVRIRLRIDGVLQDLQKVSKGIHQEIISRIKILSDLRTDEHQAAQDGRFRLSLPGQPLLDVRVSIAPTYHGENAVLRLLSDQAQDFTLDTMGFSARDQAKILRAAHRPYGMILVTGPTGSGKTTTLYSLIKLLNTPAVSIVTVEDPIEYAIDGIEQIQVNARTELTFANGLRSILRQDPDIIMVGEIRDRETAGIAVNTALTGHLLLSTLHTNDAATTLPRLIDMKIEPYLIASTVNLAIGQRLVRQVCPDCKSQHPLTEAEYKSLSEILPPKSLKKGEMFSKGVGCDQCNNTGYKGRLGVFEVMVIDDAIREAILRKGQASELRQLAVAQGMTSMVEDGLSKAKAGLTSIEEILRILHE